MKVINFSDKKFRDIPKQDNPAFDNYECMMVVKGRNDNQFNLIHVNPNSLEEGRNKRVGIFYDETIALNMAECYAKNDAYFLDAVDDMCIESLSPDNFEKWENIKGHLCAVRKQLRNTP